VTTKLVAALSGRTGTVEIEGPCYNFFASRTGYNNLAALLQGQEKHAGRAAFFNEGSPLIRVTQSDGDKFLHAAANGSPERAGPDGRRRQTAIRLLGRVPT
jgi:hypothetical protein